MTPVKRTWAMIQPRLSPEARERFWSLVREGDGCWEWQGSRNHHGYGQFTVPGIKGQITAHRIAYGLTHGTIPDGLNVLHSCDNRRCCNPAHLRAGTHRENMQEAWDRGRDRRRQRRWCRGRIQHEMTPENVSWRIVGGRKIRRCLACLDVAARIEAARITARRSAWVAQHVAPLLSPTLDALVDRVGWSRAGAIADSFGLYGRPSRTLEAIGAASGITRERVRQLRDDGLRRIGVDVRDLLHEAPRRFYSRRPRRSAVTAA